MSPSPVTSSPAPTSSGSRVPRNGLTPTRSAAYRDRGAARISSGVPVCDTLPVLEQDQALGEHRRLDRVVRHDHADAGEARELVPDQFANAHARADVERRERLVEQQQAGLDDERASERDALRLAAREIRAGARRRGSPDRAARAARMRVRARPAWARPRARSGNATFSVADRCGNSSRSWKTTPIGRRSGGTCTPLAASSRTRSSSAIVPSSGAAGRRSSRRASTSRRRWVRGARPSDRPRPRTPRGPRTPRAAR